MIKSRLHPVVHCDILTHTVGRMHACKSPEMARFWEVSQRVSHKLLGYTAPRSLPKWLGFQKVPRSIPQAFG